MTKMLFLWEFWDVRECPDDDKDLATTRDTQNDCLATFLVFETFSIFVFQGETVLIQTSNLVFDGSAILT